MPNRDPIYPESFRSEVESSLVSSSWLPRTRFRLDAPAFLSREHLYAVIPQHGHSKTLAELADVFTVYIQSPVLAYVKPFKHSRPYLTTSELAEHQSGTPTHISILADPRLVGWEIKRGTIVVSRSGRVGEAYWVDKKLDGALVGDSFRVVPKSPQDAHFLYAFLSSDFARKFLSGSAYGSVVDHASLDQLRGLAIPLISPSVKSAVTTAIGKAIGLRETAYDYIDEAHARIERLCHLPRLDSTPFQAHANITTTISSSEISTPAFGKTEYRLEAHFHNPLARAALSNLRKYCKSTRTLAEVTEDIRMSPLFVRNYVKEGHGVPYIAGKQISQIRPNFKFISRTETAEIHEHILHAGWTLMTCAGTIGRIGYVARYLDGAAAQDVMRIIPNSNEMDGGYLNAWLSSPYGRVLIERCRYGSVIDRVSPSQTGSIPIPELPRTEQEAIGNLIRNVYANRAEALLQEDHAHEILLSAITGKSMKEN